MINFNRKHFPKGKFAFMVSMGADSLAAAHYLHSKGFDLELIHFNQNYIASDLDAELSFLKFCHEFDIAGKVLYTREKFDCGSIEDFSRRVRYEAVIDYCAGKYSYIGTAHSASDCMESYLMNALKGHPDYAPIPVMCEYRKNDYITNIFRPFLLTDRNDFVKYILDNKLNKYVIYDPLNGDVKLTRAWVRHQLIPLIGTRFNGLSKTVNKITKRFIDRDLKFNNEA